MALILRIAISEVFAGEEPPSSSLRLCATGSRLARPEPSIGGSVWDGSFENGRQFRSETWRSRAFPSLFRVNLFMRGRVELIALALRAGYVILIVAGFLYLWFLSGNPWPAVGALT